MKKLLILALVAFVPLALFAQAPAGKSANKEAELLKSFNLGDEQIAQVRDIEKSTMTAVRSDSAHVQLINAQIKVAFLTASTNADLQAIDKLIDQKAQLRADMGKAFASARMQLVQIMGKDNFEKYFLSQRMQMRMHMRGIAAERGQFGNDSMRDDGNGDRMGAE
jgi:hypothetical protein